MHLKQRESGENFVTLPMGKQLEVIFVHLKNMLKFFDLNCQIDDTSY